LVEVVALDTRVDELNAGARVVALELVDDPDPVSPKIQRDIRSDAERGGDPFRRLARIGHGTLELLVRGDDTGQEPLAERSQPDPSGGAVK
jgi:hypothetical protein